jgi:zinc and cadmium transporter
MISLFGGCLPFLGKVTHGRLQLYLSASAGVMLGACFFHVMPDAMALAGEYFGWWMSLGVVGLFCIERFIAPHSHELDGGGQQNHGHAHHHHAHEHDHPHHDHEHQHGHARPKEQHAAAPAVAGWMAVIGLTIHTFMNGVGLAGSVDAAFQEAKTPFLAVLALPGVAMFLAIFLHKPADALAISMVLSRKGVSRFSLFLVQFGFACMIPLGALAYYLAKDQVGEALEHQVTGFALAFSAGTFLFIALSDLLPEVQFHRHDRIPLFLALILGVALMGGIALLEEQGGAHSHGGHEHKGHKHHTDEDHDADEKKGKGDTDHDHDKKQEHKDHDHD